MVYYEGCVTELKIPTQTALKLVEMQSFCVTIKTAKPSLSAIVSPWSIGICGENRLLLFPLCMCASYYIVSLSVQLDALTSTSNRYRHTRKTHSDYAWGISPGSMGGRSNTCAVRTLCPQHTSHRYRILVQFIEINTIGGNQCVAAGLLAAVVAHGCISIQQGSV